MARKIINVGVADKGNGDPIRVAFSKANDNFAELYNILSNNTGGSIITTDVIGSVFADDSTLLVDGINGSIPYSVLSGAPTIPAAQVQSNWTAASGMGVILNKPTFATVATTGAYADLTGKPTIPTSFSSLVNGAHQVALVVGGAGPYVTFPADDGVSIGFQGGDIGIIGGEALLSSTEYGVRLTANSTGTRKDWEFATDGSLTLPGDLKWPSGGGNIRSDGNIDIEINLADSTLRRWQFGEDGILTLPSTGKISNSGYDWTFGSNGSLTFPDNTISTGKGITIPVDQSLTVNLSTSGPGPELDNTFKINPESIKLLSGNGTIYAGDETAANRWDLDSTNKTLYFPDAGDGVLPQIRYSTVGNDGMQLFTAAKPIKITTASNTNWNFGTDGSLTIPGDIRSEGDINIDINLADSTLRRWRFGEDGVLTFPDGTNQTTAYTGGGGTSIPTVVTTGAVGEGGAAHVKVQFTVASATTVTAVGVTVIGISNATSGRITLSGSPGTGSFDIVAATNVQSQTFVLMPFATNASGTGYGAPIAGTGTNPCLVRGTMITMADMSRVAVENITYNDDILVWDFDLGEFASAKPIWIKKTQTAVVSCLLTFSDHSELRIVGESPKAHRIFNKEAGKFTYGSMPETPIGTTTFNDQGEEITLISKEWIVGEVEFYNVMTDYHMNLFANSILTSMRYNNVYPITDMKFVKDSRTLRTADDYPNVEERLYKGFRLAEQTQSVEEIETHIQWLMSLEVERETECV